MKYDMLKSGVLIVGVAAVFGTGCVNPVKDAKAAGSNNLSSGGCSVSSISGGAKVSCADGTQADILGGMGLQGPAGPAGSAGPAGPAGSAGPAGAQGSPSSFVLRMGNSAYVGTHLVNYTPGGSGTYVAYDNNDLSFVVYSSVNGLITSNPTYYYADNLCASGALVDRFQPVGMVGTNYSSQLMRVTNVSVSTTVIAYKTASTNCTAMASTSGTYSQASTYAGSFPTSLTFPVTIVKQ